MLLDDIEHLPKVVTNVLGIKDVLLAIEPEIIQLRKDISDLIKELYVKTTEDFITRWEKDFSLKYDASLTLEQRRQRILNKLARKRPLTWNNLRLLIKNNLAENVQFYLSNDSANYHFRIIINPEMEEVFDASNFTVVGSPTITDDGVLVCSTTQTVRTNYITTGALKPQALKGKSWEIKGSFYTGGGLDTFNNNILAIGNMETAGIIYRPSADTLSFACNIGTNQSNRHSISRTFTNIPKNTVINFSYKFDYRTKIYTFSYNDALQTSDASSYDEFELYNINTSNTQYSFQLGSLWPNYDCTYPIDLKQFSITVDGVKVFSGTKRVPKGISEMEKAVKQAKPAYLTFDILVTDLVRRCGTFNCGTNPL